MELLPTSRVLNQKSQLTPLSKTAESSPDLQSLVSELVVSGKLVYLDPQSGARQKRFKREEQTKLQEESLGLLGPIALPIMVHGLGKRVFQWYTFSRLFPVQGAGLASADGPVNSVLVYGLEADSGTSPIVRLHSGCQTGDILGSMRCDCGPQFRESLRRIVEHEAGVLVYLPSHEGRGIGLWAKALTYILQDRGHDTYSANELLGFPADARSYADAIGVLRHLLGHRKKIVLLSNNPQKREELEGSGFRVVKMQKLVAGINEHNAAYLEAKIRRGHTISHLDLVGF